MNPRGRQLIPLLFLLALPKYPSAPVLSAKVRAPKVCAPISVCALRMSMSHKTEEQKAFEFNRQRAKDLTVILEDGGGGVLKESEKLRRQWGYHNKPNNYDFLERSRGPAPPPGVTTDFSTVSSFSTFGGCEWGCLEGPMGRPRGKLNGRRCQRGDRYMGAFLAFCL